MRYLTAIITQLQVAWLLLLCRPTLAGTAPPTTLHGCPSLCGNISIPYPFDIGKGCSWSKSFNVSCNHSHRYDPPRPSHGGFEVIDIKLDAGEMRVFTTPFAHLRYNSSSTASSRSSPWYNFSMKHLSGTWEMSLRIQLGKRTVKLVLDWAILKSGTCHSECRDIVRQDGRPGYRCRSLDGRYAGNPYVDGGCQIILTVLDICSVTFSDVHECKDPTTDSCPRANKCVDMDEEYECKCNFGRKFQDCRPAAAAVVFDMVAATVVASVLLALLLWIVNKEKKRRQRTGFFARNGGKILRGMGINIFTQEQLKKMTRNYSTLIGQGAFGKDGNGREMYDRDIVLSDVDGECLDRIGALAVRCLKENVDQRPTMAEVVKELKLVRGKPEEAADGNGHRQEDNTHR
ncbi:hypothetical protein EJB05_31514, partial [Eragrostis curvula]